MSEVEQMSGSIAATDGSEAATVRFERREGVWYLLVPAFTHWDPWTPSMHAPTKWVPVLDYLILLEDVQNSESED